MFTLEIVSHVWNYSSLLAYQLSSLILCPPAAVDVTATVFYSPADHRTAATLEYFAALVWPANVTLRPWVLSTGELCRRAIGRNLAAKATVAEWVWFCDVDHCFGTDCLDSLPAELATVRGPLAYPAMLLQNVAHADGDAAIAAVAAPRVIDIPAGPWEIKTNPAAIGGLQIVRGDIARSAGYLPHDRRFQRPADKWERTFCDVSFRKSLGAGGGEPIDIPNLYRIRHSSAGRDVAGLQL